VRLWVIRSVKYPPMGRNDRDRKMNAEENSTCPKCGALVSQSDKFCKNCGTDLTRPPEAIQASPPPASPAEHYDRKFTTFQRLFRILISPSEIMRDIGYAPEYEGFFSIAIAEFAVSIVTVMLILGKIHVVGEQAGSVNDIVQSVMAFSIILVIGLFIVKWLVKSWIVKSVCDGGGWWDFRTAAAITGYAYIADFVIGVLSTVLIWFLVPSFTIDTANLDAARQAMSNYQTQLRWLKLMYTLPATLLGLVWKSYLGGLGCHFGTKERFSVGTGFVLFFVLGLFSLLLSLFT